MARRTKAQIRAEKIAAIEARRREEDVLLRELKREAAKEEKAVFDAAAADLGRWLLGEAQATSLDDIAAVREALDNAKTLRSLREKVAAVSAVADGSADQGAGDDFDDDLEDASPGDGNGSDSATGGEADTSEQSADVEAAPASSFGPWR
jgi:hypothetical protein